MRAFASDPRSQSRLLCLQGLFDAFCVYRSYVLGPDVLKGGIEIFRSWKRQGNGNAEAFTKLSYEGKSAEEPCEGLRQTLFNILSLLLKLTRSVQLILEIHCYRKRGRQEALKLCVSVELLKLLLKALLYTLAPFSVYCDESNIALAVVQHRQKQVGKFQSETCSQV